MKCSATQLNVFSILFRERETPTYSFSFTLLAFSVILLLTESELQSFSKKFSSVKIAVIGDLMLDRYVFGEVNRVSPEAPVPILDFASEETRLGGAANVANNIKALGANVQLYGIVGNHAANNDLFRARCAESGLLEDNIAGVVEDSSRTTTVKVRYISKLHHLRVDYENKHAISSEIEDTLISRLSDHISSLQCIILEDYNKGVLTPTLIRRVIDLAKSHNIPTFVDPKFDNFLEYKGVTLFKPNLKEMQDALGVKLHNDAEINAAGFKLLEMLGAENVLLTLSEKGMRLFERGATEPFAIATRARHVADVSGAGDTVIATLAVATASGSTIREASVMANRAAGLVVESLGIVPIQKAQLFEALGEDVGK